MDFFQELKSKTILSQDDINNFKDYINKKYKDSKADKKQAVLKNSINFVINRDLTILQVNKKDETIDYLIETVLFKNQEDLSADKIFERIIANDKPSDNLFQGLSQWINGMLATSLEAKHIKNYYHKKYQSQSTPTVKNKLNFPLGLLLVAIGIYSLSFIPLLPNYVGVSQVNSEADLKISISDKNLRNYSIINRNFPDYFQYRDINKKSLETYLASKKSKLAGQPYFSQILTTSQEFNLNPLLLFAIAGHEQGFVPIDHPRSQEIINNPFNVFESWQDYNTDLEDSSRIAARTLVNILRDLPPLIDPFYWINGKYAQDPHWWQGVRSIFWTLEEIS